MEKRQFSKIEEHLFMMRKELLNEVNEGLDLVQVAQDSFNFTEVAKIVDTLEIKLRNIMDILG